MKTPHIYQEFKMQYVIMTSLLIFNYCAATDSRTNVDSDDFRKLERSRQSRANYGNNLANTLDFETALSSGSHLPVITYVAKPIINKYQLESAPGFFGIALKCIKWMIGQAIAFVVGFTIAAYYCISTGHCHSPFYFGRSLGADQSYLNIDTLQTAADLLNKGFQTYHNFYEY